MNSLHKSGRHSKLVRSPLPNGPGQSEELALSNAKGAQRRRCKESASDQATEDKADSLGRSQTWALGMVSPRVRCYETLVSKHPPDTARLSRPALAMQMAGPREDRQFTFSEVGRGLQYSLPPHRPQGFTVFFTGLSGAGKSTIAKALRAKFLETGDGPVTLLDGDVVRKRLSPELGFSKQHRDIHIRRIGFLASEITKNGGIAICAPIAPYDRVRKEVRAMIESHGGFVLVYVSTPLSVCEARDRKGLYAKARTGLIQNFTGISDPYEPPNDANVVIDTTELSPEEAAQEIYSVLERGGCIGGRIR